MTEKRFIEVDDGLDFSIKHIESGEMFYDCESVVDILNELAEENKELKSKYSEQCIQLDFLKDENQHMRDLVNENEQLKKAWKYNCEICEKSKKFRQYEVKTECEDFELDLEKVLK